MQLSGQLLSLQLYLSVPHLMTSANFITLIPRDFHNERQPENKLQDVFLIFIVAFAI